MSVHYYAEYVSGSVANAARLARDIDATQWVAVANKPGLDLDLIIPAGSGCLVSESVAHSNDGQEFGAYEVGLQRVVGTRDPPWVLFVNDTFDFHSPFPSVYRRHLTDALKTFAKIDLPMIVGEEQSLTRSYDLLGNRTHRWVRTNLFALNRAARNLLDRRLRWKNLDELIIEDADESRFFSASIDPVLREHLRSWLFRPGRKRPSWHGAAPLNPINAAKMAAKARAILQEKYLAAVLEVGGTWFFDISEPNNFRERLWSRAEQTISNGLARHPKPLTRHA